MDPSLTAIRSAPVLCPPSGPSKVTRLRGGTAAVQRPSIILGLGTAGPKPQTNARTGSDEEPAASQLSSAALSSTAKSPDATTGVGEAKKRSRHRRPTPAMGLGCPPGALSQTLPAQGTTHFALECKGYILHETIGSGGYSKVKVATHLPTNMRVCTGLGFGPEETRARWHKQWHAGHGDAACVAIAAHR
jgi:hypothetical protein